MGGRTRRRKVVGETEKQKEEDEEVEEEVEEEQCEKNQPGYACPPP